MYSRYAPNAKGCYEKRPVDTRPQQQKQEPRGGAPRRPEPPRPSACKPEPPGAGCGRQDARPECGRPEPQRGDGGCAPPCPPPEKPCFSRPLPELFGRLLPDGMDTGDLLTLLILLLVLFDEQEDSLCLLIAIALFLFMK